MTGTTPGPRERARRIRDTLELLHREVDVWVATADAGSGMPYLVPLSYLWDGATVLLATPEASPTGRNLRTGSRVRLGFGQTRDVVLVEGEVAGSVPAPGVPADVGDAFAARTGFDPRTLTTRYRYYRIRPDRVQAWREADELSGRDLMRGGRWLHEPAAGNPGPGGAGQVNLTSG